MPATSRLRQGGSRPGRAPGPAAAAPRGASSSRCPPSASDPARAPARTHRRAVATTRRPPGDGRVRRAPGKRSRSPPAQWTSSTSQTGVGRPRARQGGRARRRTLDRSASAAEAASGIRRPRDPSPRAGRTSDAQDLCPLAGQIPAPPAARARDVEVVAERRAQQAPATAANGADLAGAQPDASRRPSRPLRRVLEARRSSRLLPTPGGGDDGPALGRPAAAARARAAACAELRVAAHDGRPAGSHRRGPRPSGAALRRPAASTGSAFPLSANSSAARRTRWRGPRPARYGPAQHRAGRCGRLESRRGVHRVAGQAVLRRPSVANATSPVWMPTRTCERLLVQRPGAPPARRPARRWRGRRARPAPRRPRASRSAPNAATPRRR